MLLSMPGSACSVVFGCETGARHDPAGPGVGNQSKLTPGHGALLEGL